MLNKVNNSSHGDITYDLDIGQTYQHTGGMCYIVCMNGSGGFALVNLETGCRFHFDRGMNGDDAKFTPIKLEFTQLSE